MKEVATIHKESFADHFLGQYSIPVIEAFYTYYLDDLFLVALDGETVAGFVLGGDIETLHKRKKAFMKNNLGLLAWNTLRTPSVWGGAVKRLSRLMSPPSGNTPEAERDRGYCILSIAVAAGYRGSGAAQELTDGFEASLPDLVADYWLAVHSDNARAIGFYEKSGFRAFKEIDELLYLIKRRSAKRQDQPTEKGPR